MYIYRLKTEKTTYAATEGSFSVYKVISRWSNYHE